MPAKSAHVMGSFCLLRYKPSCQELESVSKEHSPVCSSFFAVSNVSYALPSNLYFKRPLETFQEAIIYNYVNQDDLQNNVKNCQTSQKITTMFNDHVHNRYLAMSTFSTSDGAPRHKFLNQTERHIFGVLAIEGS